MLNKKVDMARSLNGPELDKESPQSFGGLVSIEGDPNFMSDMGMAAESGLFKTEMKQSQRPQTKTARQMQRGIPTCEA
jgi:hypothetical protein